MPAFLTMIGIPFFYNIGYGLIAGIISYMVLNVIPWLILKATRGRVVPEGWYTEREPWGVASTATFLDVSDKQLSRTQRFIVQSSIFPTWLKKLSIGQKCFWRMTPAEIEDHLEGRRVTELYVKERGRRRREERDLFRQHPPPPREPEETKPISVMGGVEKYEV